MVMRLIFLILFSSWGSFTMAATHHPQEFLAAIKGKPDEGEQIVKHFCANCHAVKPLIPLGAPRIGQEEDWTARFEQGLKVLLKHTEEGLNAMPARGGCFECSDEQLILAILALLPQKLHKASLIELKDYKKNN